MSDQKQNDQKGPEQVKQNAQPPVKEVEAKPEDRTEMLLNLFIEQKAADLEKAKIEREKEARLQTARERNSTNRNVTKKMQQKNCHHLKGGKHRNKSVVDYAVYSHTFIDGTTYIRCQLCGMKWFELDTAAALVRKNNKGDMIQIPNHTDISWSRAVEMVGQSTNKKSSAEIPLEATYRIVADKEPDLDDQEYQY